MAHLINLKFMPEIKFKQPAVLGKIGFTYSARGLFAKNIID